VSWRWID